jgi:hypothetical protein
MRLEIAFRFDHATDKIRIKLIAAAGFADHFVNVHG